MKGVLLNLKKKHSKMKGMTMSKDYRHNDTSVRTEDDRPVLLDNIMMTEDEQRELDRIIECSRYSERMAYLDNRRIV